MFEKYAFIIAMREILTHPTKKFSVRELSRASKLSVNASKYSLDYLLGKEMIQLKKIGRTYQYQANMENYLTRQWKVLFNLEDIEKAQIVKNALDTGLDIISIIIYGSAAIGKDDENSDLDILILAETTSEKRRELAALSCGTTKEINISVYSPHEWKQKANKDRIFYEQAVINSVVLYGEKPVIL